MNLARLLADIRNDATTLHVQMLIGVVTHYDSTRRAISATVNGAPMDELPHLKSYVAPAIDDMIAVCLINGQALVLGAIEPVRPVPND